MRYILFLIWMIGLTFFSCKFKNEKQETIDNITFDPTKDSPDFSLCNEKTKQYFNDSNGLIYEGEKPVLEKIFYTKYNSSIVDKKTGLIRIRFLVNCEGEAGRFRLLSMNENYEEEMFDAKITNQLLKITKSLKGWGIKKHKGKPINYYQYLIFVLQNGEITKILP